MVHVKTALIRAVPASLALTMCAGAALAQDGAEVHDDLATKWKVDDADPMASIPSVEERNSDPLEFGYYLQDMLFRAEGAYRKQDWQAAIKYYKPLSVAVPAVARSFSRMCDAYAHMNEPAQAIESCREAIRLKGAKVIDHVRYVDLMLRKPSFGASDAADVSASLDHLREHARQHPQPLPGERPVVAPKAEPKPDEVARPGWNAPPALTLEQKAAALDAEKERMKEKMRKLLGDDREPAAESAAGGMHLPTQIELSSCRLAVRTGDSARLAECTAQLRAYKAPEKLLLPFYWADALQRHDQARAGAVLDEAVKSGVKRDVLASMEAEQAKVFGAGPLAQLRSRWPLIAGGLALALSVLVFFGKRRSVRERLAPA